LALRMLRPDHPALSAERLSRFLADGDDGLRLEAVRTLRDSRLAERGELLAQIAASQNNSADLRAEAIVGLAPDDSKARALLVSLASDQEPVVSHEALRSLRGCRLETIEREPLARIGGRNQTTADLVTRILEPDRVQALPADDVAGWLAALRGTSGRIEGDARAGERVFFQRSAICSRCHQIAGRGGTIGPELTTATGALAEQRLVESILLPSKEIAPQFVSWTVITTDGKSLVGALVHQEPTGEQTYADREGHLTVLSPDEIEARRPNGASIMPEGLASQLTLQEFRDLVAYLRAP
jgi:putative heme-binding domain-containing protein